MAYPVFQPPDYSNAMTAGAYTRSMREQEERRQEAAPLAAAAVGGDRAALERLATVDPDRAVKIAGVMRGLSTSDAAEAKRQSDFLTRAGMGILSAPPDQRAARYAAALEEAKANGFDVSRMPGAYDPATEQRIRFMVDQVRPVGEYFRSQRPPTTRGGRTTAGPVLGLDTAAPPPGAPVAARPPAFTMAPGTQTVDDLLAGGDPSLADPGDPQSGGGIVPTQYTPPGQQPPAPAAPPAFAPPPGAKIVTSRGKPVVQNGNVYVQLPDGSRTFIPLNPKPAGGVAPGGVRLPRGYQPTPDDPTRIEPVPGGPADTRAKDAVGKPLGPGERKDLKKIADPASDMSRIADTFESDYAGKMFGALGTMENYVRKKFGDPTGQAAFWQDYDNMANQVRNDLFGAALTATEARAFQAAMIDPSMDPDVARENLNRQKFIMMRGLARQALAMAESGFNRRAIELAIGVPLDTLPDPMIPYAPPPRIGRPAPPARTPPAGAPPATPPQPAPQPAAPPSAPAAPAGSPLRLKFNPQTGDFE